MSNPRPFTFAARRHARPALRAARFCAAALACWLLASPATAQREPDDTIVQARDALRKKDASRLAATRAAVMAVREEERHPLAMWVEYWELLNRLPGAQQDELEAFYSRWSGTYVEDRLRNDWLLELGRRRDWVNFAREFPRFRMNDDREVTCYALLADHLAGRVVVEAARNAWFAQREADDGCALMAQTLFESRHFSAADVWRKARLSVDAGRPRAVSKAVALLGEAPAGTIGEVLDNPARYLTRRAGIAGRTAAELTTLALSRMAGNDPEAVAEQMNQRWQRALPPDLAAWAWASIGRNAAMKLNAEAAGYYDHAHQLSASGALGWSEDMRAWAVRAALRADAGKPRWPLVLASIDAMPEPEQRDPTWVYWKARALRAMGADGPEGAAQRAAGTDLLRSLSGQLHFYGTLAAEDLGEPVVLPSPPLELTAAERVAAVRNLGLERALRLIAIGLRSEGVREWNFTLRGMSDRELLAAADWACQREVWDRCINTSDRTRSEIDMTQRFPMPFRNELVARAREIGLDPAYVYGLIRQESRFVSDARSGVGASGLMQVMPATARWTAKKIGLPYTQDMITDRDVNLRIGTSYLKLVLDDFGGSQAMAAAAYNAGPSRPRKWREGPVLEPAIWAENIPFSETRDYVKKVLSNATYYAALISGQSQSLKARLGRFIGPRDAAAPAPNTDLP